MSTGLTIRPGKGWPRLPCNCVTKIVRVAKVILTTKLFMMVKPIEDCFYHIFTSVSKTKAPNFFFRRFVIASVLDHVTDFDFNFHRSKNLVKMKWVKIEGKRTRFSV